MFSPPVRAGRGAGRPRLPCAGGWQRPTWQQAGLALLVLLGLFAVVDYIRFRGAWHKPTVLFRPPLHDSVPVNESVPRLWASSARRRLIVVPVNGLANRMRAMTSARVLADYTRRELWVHWEPEASITPVAFSGLFEDTTAYPLIDPADMGALSSGLEDAWVTRKPGVLRVWGRGEGEDPFVRLLVAAEEPDVILVAGGTFAPPFASGAAFKMLQSAAYRQLRFVPAIVNDVAAMTARWPGGGSASTLGAGAGSITSGSSRLGAGSSSGGGGVGGGGRTVGVQVRFGDRSSDSPSHGIVMAALANREVVPRFDAVFLCSDDLTQRGVLARSIGEAFGVPVFAHEWGHISRDDASDMMSAVVDWVTLASTDFVVYSHESSYGHEAQIPRNVGGYSMPRAQGSSSSGAGG